MFWQLQVVKIGISTKINLWIETTTNLTFRDIQFSDIKKIPRIYIFSVIIVGFYFTLHYKMI